MEINANMKYKILIITDLVIFILIGLNYKFKLFAEAFALFFDCSKTASSCTGSLCDVAGAAHPCFSMINGLSVTFSWLVLLIVIVVSAILFMIWAVKAKHKKGSGLDS